MVSREQLDGRGAVEHVRMHLAHLFVAHLPLSSVPEADPLKSWHK